MYSSFIILLTFLELLQLRLNSYGHIIGTEYLSDLVEKELPHKHGNLVYIYIFWSKRNLSCSIDSDLELYLLSTCLTIAEIIKKKKYCQ